MVQLDEFIVAPQFQTHGSGIEPDLDDVVGPALEGRFAGVQIRVDRCNGTAPTVTGMVSVEFEQLPPSGWGSRRSFLPNCSLAMALARP